MLLHIAHIQSPPEIGRRQAFDAHQFFLPPQGVGSCIERRGQLDSATQVDGDHRRNPITGDDDA
jgi:hypothetical protein